MHEYPSIYSFTFTGKERDEETHTQSLTHTIFLPNPRVRDSWGKKLEGSPNLLAYHGARYFDAALLTSWMAVDPMSDKYPHVSPYNYCEWNPVVLKDDNGEFPLAANIMGAAASALVDVAGQVIDHTIQGDIHCVQDVLNNVDWSDVAVSAVEGFVTCGGNIVAKNATKTAVKVGAAVVRSTVDISKKDGAEINKGGEIARNLVYESIGAGGGKAKSHLHRSPKVQSANKAVKQARAANPNKHISTPEAKAIAGKTRAKNAQKKACNKERKSATSTHLWQGGSSAAKGLESKVKNDTD